MKQIAIPKLAKYPDEKIERFFQRIDDIESPFIAIEICQEDEDFLVSEWLRRHNPSSSQVITTQCSTGEKFELCIQTMVSVKDALYYDKSIVEICSKVVSLRDSYPKPYIDDAWNDMIRCLNKKGKYSLVFTSDNDYMSLIQSEDATRFFNIILHQRDNIKCIFLVERGFNLNRSESFFRKIYQVEFTYYMKEETPMVPPIYISHHWGQTDALTESVTAQFNK